MKHCDVSIKLFAEVRFWDVLLALKADNGFNLNHLACKPLKRLQTFQSLVTFEAAGCRSVTFLHFLGSLISAGH